jgi:serine/threonine protein kinase/tetratricopeptide (TPR) repeat protein
MSDTLPSRSPEQSGNHHPEQEALPETRTIPGSAPVLAGNPPDTPAGSGVPPTWVTNTPRPVIRSTDLMPEGDITRSEPVASYEVLGELGRGAMGVVYKARQLALNRIVALKCILAGELALPSEIARFRAEAEVLAQLEHPNIVQIYEIGADSGRPFFSMEFVEGGSLAALIRGKPQPARMAAWLVETLAWAMHAVHQRGIVHRDLKPGNVLMKCKGAEASASSVVSLDQLEPKITDFGLAKRLDEAGGRTAEGVLVGTPCYMAPEQAEGRLKDIGPVTDVYALAAILYELITGRPPFTAPDLLDILSQVRTQEPVPPRRLQPTCPRDLEIICLKGLQKEFWRRYESAQELAEDLRHFREGKPIRARPVPGWERALKWARRRPTQAALAFAVVLAVLGMVVGSLFFGLYEREKATLAEKENQAQRQQSKRRAEIDQRWRQAEAAKAEAQVALSQGRPEEADLQFRTAYESLQSAQALIDTDPEAIEGELRRQIDRGLQQAREQLDDLGEKQKVQARSKRFAKARETVLLHDVPLPGASAAWHREEVRRLAKQALDEWEVKAEGPPAEAVKGLARQGRHFESEEQQELARHCYELLLIWAEAEADTPVEVVADRVTQARRALGLLELAEALGQAHGVPTPKAFHVRRARYLSQAGDEPAARAARALAEPMKSVTALDFFLSGLESYRQGQFRPAAQACAAALQLPTDPFWPQYLQALCYFQLKRPAEALAGLTACLSRQPDFLWARVVRALAHAELRELPEAEADFALALRQAKEPADRYVILTNRGAMWARRQKWDAAVEDLVAASKLQASASEPHANLAYVYQERESWQAALSELNKALACQPGDPALYYTRAQLHQKRGDRAGARRDYEQVIALNPRDRKKLASSHVLLAHLCHLDGEYPAALAECDAALQVFADFSPAYLQRTDTLLQLKRGREAGEALDRYLSKTENPKPADYKARGLIHHQLGEFPAALEAFNRALLRDQAPEILSLRGWVYLNLGAADPALADFEAVLKRSPRHADALCGRAHARVALGKVAEAVKDAEASLKALPATDRNHPRLLLNVACVYARAMLPRTPKQSRREQIAADRYETRAVDLVREALERTPAGERRAFWRESIQKEPALTAIRRGSAMQQLARLYGS